MGAVPPFRGRGAGSHLAQYGLGRGLPPAPYQGHVDPSSRLGTIDMGRKLGAVPTFWGGGAGSPSSTVWPGLRLHAKWHLDPSSRLANGHNRHGPKIGGCAFFWGGGGGLGPHLTQSPGPRPTSILSDILIYPAVWHVLGGDTHWRQLSNTIEPSMCGSDEACCQITLTTCLIVEIKYITFPCYLYLIEQKLACFS